MARFSCDGMSPPAFRPSAQQAQAKKEAWQDLQSVMKELGLPMPKKTDGG